MVVKSIYTSKDSEKEMMELYNKQLTQLNIEYEERMIATHFGNTHVLVTGPKDAPPLVTIHGGNGNTPLNLSLFLPLTKYFRIFAPDTIGFPGKSEQARLSPKDNSYGKWVVDVLNGLNLGRVPFLTSSYSSGILLKTASLAPERITCAVLLAPSGIAHGSVLTIMYKLVIPWMMYKLFPDRDRLIKAFTPMMTETNEDFLEFTDAMLRCYKMELWGPKEISKKDIANFNAPTFIIAAKDDIFFPADKVIPKAKKIINNVVKTEYIDGNHLPSKKTLEYINSRIIEFLNVYK